MSALWLKLTTLLCLLFTALSAPENSGVIKKHLGEYITIQCKCSETDQTSLQLRKGLNKEVQVLYHDGKTQKDTIAKEFQTRLQVHAEFPKVDILIKNLTSDDTGPYFCLYEKYDTVSPDMKMTEGSGSVLLVVEGDRQKEISGCNPQKDMLVMVSVVISAAVLIFIIMGVLFWIIKNKTTKSTKKPRSQATNDVYEDMRGTLRR
ncbi:uncharacterized protein [Channa argus]|uniref:uncharacterized protein n=1 Tax=Channa argus TaxID=215402 RepID=UPI00294499C8|nr:hypothetical protein Q8A73_016404 [Channa argus]